MTPAGGDYPWHAYVPGRTARPPEEAFDAYKEGVSTDSSIDDLASSRAFGGGLAFYRACYFWEAHEVWEAVWTCLPPASAERHLLRGLIQFANAGLKTVMDRPAAAARILGLADVAIAEAFLHRPGRLMGLTDGDVAALRTLVVSSKKQYNA